MLESVSPIPLIPLQSVTLVKQNPQSLRIDRLPPPPACSSSAANRSMQVARRLAVKPFASFRMSASNWDIVTCGATKKAKAMVANEMFYNVTTPLEIQSLFRKYYSEVETMSISAELKLLISTGNNVVTPSAPKNTRKRRAYRHASKRPDSIREA